MLLPMPLQARQRKALRRAPVAIFSPARDSHHELRTTWVRIEVRLDSVSRNGGIERRRAVLDLERNWLVGAIQHDDHRKPIRTQEGSGFEAIVRGASPIGPGLTLITPCVGDVRAEPPRSGQDVLREVAYGVILRVDVDLPRFHEHGCIADVVHMVGPAILVEKEIPIDPPCRTGVQVTDDVMRVTLTKGPISGDEGAAWFPSIPLEGSLRGKQHGLREVFADLRYAIKVIPCVPMEGNTGSILRSSGVRVEGLSPRVHIFLVVVEH
mmetsp:Transcript_134522/g.335628  ORF Transcript_134522/g.335628 Transcript_134522/m.335628 type:complete len:267 (-) Transcript_134522:882-1682(-)